VRAAWHAALDATTAWLWEAVMAPVVEHLTQIGVSRAVLIPSGLLGLLPLHAAGGEGRGEMVRRYALDSVAFSYAPSSLALAASQQQAQAIPADALLAVDNPDSSLLFSGQEVDAALSHFDPGRRLRLAGPIALLEVVKLALPGRSVLHFSTHGWAGWGNPLQGGLLLAGDAHLTLEEILELRLPAARLAVLSACETGVPGTRLPDEVVGLPAGLLQAGVAGVVASLWAVNDLSTARLMERFYEHWRGEGLAPADALCQAQRWLRDVTRRELGAYYASFIRRLPPQEAQAARAELSIGGDPDDRPYSHPFHWAAFTFSGA
jgi:CHAT domain-containing protein